MGQFQRERFLLVRPDMLGKMLERFDQVKFDQGKQMQELVLHQRLVRTVYRVFKKKRLNSPFAEEVL